MDAKAACNWPRARLRAPEAQSERNQSAISVQSERNQQAIHLEQLQKGGAAPMKQSERNQSAISMRFTSSSSKRAALLR